MATTTNFGWETPDDTDLVKDGALAQRTTADAIDSTLFALTQNKNTGLVLLNSTSFTSQTSVNIDNVFSNSYSNYRIIVTISSQSAAAQLYYRMRTSAPATDSTSNYYLNNFGNTSWTTGTAVNNSPAVATQGEIGYSTGGRHYFVGDILNPFPATPTYFVGMAIGADETRVRNQRMGASTAFAGINIYPASGNITGTVQIFGYRNS